MQRYDVEINGFKTTQLLSEADAKARGLIAPTAPEITTKAKAPANKSRKPANKRAEPAAEASAATSMSDEE